MHFFIIVHSFVRRLHRYVFSTDISVTDISRIFGADLELTDPFSAAIYHGPGGLTLDRWTGVGELSVVRDLSPSAVIIDIGTNDLSRADWWVYHVCMV